MRKKIITLYTASILSLMTALPMAADAATLNQNVTLESANLTLGDIFQDVNAPLGHVLAPAPHMGQKMVLNASDLNRIANAFAIKWQANGHEQVVVKRASTDISHTEVKDSVTQAIRKIMPNPLYDLDVKNRDLGFIVAGTFLPEIRIEDVRYDRQNENFSANIRIYDETNNMVAQRKLVGKITQMIEVPVLSQNMSKKSIIGAQDINMIRIPANSVSQNMILTTDDLIGMAPRRNITAHQPISANDIQAPIIIKKGEIVTMQLVHKRMRLTAQGKALDHGSKGEVIRIQNMNSRQVIEAKVTGPQKVEIITARAY